MLSAAIFFCALSALTHCNQINCYIFRAINVFILGLPIFRYLIVSVGTLKKFQVKNTAPNNFLWNINTIISNQQNLLYFSAYKTEAFPFQNSPKNLDLSYKMDLDLWDCLGRAKFVSYEGVSKSFEPQAFSPFR